MRLLTNLEHDENADRAVDARGLRSQVDGKFILVLEICCVVFSETKTLSDHLQSATLDLAAAVDLIQVVALRLTELRNDDEFEKMWLKITDTARECNIDLPKPKMKRATKTLLIFSLP